MSFDHRRVLAFESRRADDMRAMIAARDGVPEVVPAVELSARGASADTAAFAQALGRGELTAVIFLTGVGVRLLAEAVEDVLSRPALAAALDATLVVARGPKPLAALRELGVSTPRPVPRPHTWRQILELLDAESPAIRDRRVAVQEYGGPASELLDGLRQRGAVVVRVPVYEWKLPIDVQPLRDAIDAVVGGAIDVLLFTAAVQVDHLFRVAAAHESADRLRSAVSRTCVGSIGPTTTEALRVHGVRPDLEPARSNMGLLVAEAAARASRVLERKREPDRSHS